MPGERDFFYFIIPFENLKKKDDKNKILNELKKYVCGLENTNGGEIHLNFEGEQSNGNMLDQDFVKPLEQQLSQMLGETRMHVLVNIERSNKKLVLFVERSNSTIQFVRYNLYIPEATQVCCIKPFCSLEEVENTFKNREVGEKVKIGSHQKLFDREQKCGLREGKTVQLKNVKCTPSKCVTLADRIVGETNKFVYYVSAFSNHKGGHIYYGITDQKDVKGQIINNNDDKEKITRKVKKTINEMVWSDDQPQRGTHWDIFFEPVENSGLSTYVIVIFIARYDGLVFTEMPESYTIVDKNLTKADVDLKTGNITNYQRSICLTQHIPRVQWSSFLNKKIYRTLTMDLTRCRNENDMDGFKRIGDLAISKYPGSCASLVVTSEMVAKEIKQYCFEEARKLIRDFKKDLQSSSDLLIFQVRELYLKSRCERGDGLHEESYQTALVGMQTMQAIKPQHMTVWFYVHASTVAIILSARAQDEECRKDFFIMAQEFFSSGEKHAKALEHSEENLCDLKQKVLIFKAFVLLGCSPTGEMVDISLIPESNLKKTELILAELKHLVKSSDEQPTGYRKIKSILVRSDLSYRYGQFKKMNELEHFKKSFKLATKAKDLSRQQHFEEVGEWAERRCAWLVKTIGEDVCIIARY